MRLVADAGDPLAAARQGDLDQLVRGLGRDEHRAARRGELQVARAGRAAARAYGGFLTRGSSSASDGGSLTPTATSPVSASNATPSGLPPTRTTRPAGLAAGYGEVAGSAARGG